MLGEGIDVDGGAGDNDLEVRAPLEQPAQVAEDEVDVEAAFVGLVDDHAVVALEPAVALDVVEEQAVGHHLDPRLLGHTLAETHGVAHLGA